ncbi:MAG: guanylate kinase [Thermoleophilaceae bacterium]|nr:guanylate kinase [Thermoleophilaceae bacterium]
MPPAAVLVVTGPSGVGKGTLIRALLARRPDLRLSVSATTRPPRSRERDGVDYHFLTPAAFEERVERGEFVEHATYAGNRYGTLRSELEGASTALVLEIELQGARQLRAAVPDAVQVFIAPPAPETLRQRLEQRASDSPEQIESRLRVARQEMAAAPEFSHVVVNDDLDRAVDELTRLVATMVSQQSRGAVQ